jgi:hypothetical protein
MGFLDETKQELNLRSSKEKDRGRVSYNKDKLT